MPRSLAIARLLLACASLAVVTAGCLGSFAHYDQRGGPAIARVIQEAHSPIVTDVWYNAGDYMDPASVTVVLRRGVPQDQALAFVCEIVLPAVRQGDPPDSFGVEVWDNNVTRIVATDLDDECPPRVSPPQD